MDAPKDVALPEFDNTTVWVNIPDFVVVADADTDSVTRRFGPLNTVMPQPWVAVACVDKSVIRIVKLSAAAEVGTVPLTNPDELRVSGESEPPAKLHAYAPLPFKPVSWEE